MYQTMYNVHCNMTVCRKNYVCWSHARTCTDCHLSHSWKGGWKISLPSFAGALPHMTWEFPKFHFCWLFPLHRLVWTPQVGRIHRWSALHRWKSYRGDDMWWWARRAGEHRWLLLQRGGGIGDVLLPPLLPATYLLSLPFIEVTYP